MKTHYNRQMGKFNTWIVLVSVLLEYIVMLTDIIIRNSVFNRVSRCCSVIYCNGISAFLFSLQMKVLVTEST